MTMVDRYGKRIMHIIRTKLVLAMDNIVCTSPQQEKSEGKDLGN